MRAEITQAVVDRAKPREQHYDIRDTRVIGFLLRVQNTGKKAYYVEYRRPEDRRLARFRIGGADVLKPAQARARAKEILAGAVMGTDPAESRRRGRAHNLKAFLQDVYSPKRLEAQRSGKATKARLLAAFKPLLGRKLDELTAFRLQGWQKARLAGGVRKKTGISKATVIRDLDALRAALNWAVREHLLSENPMAGLERLRNDSDAKTRYLTPDEETRLFGALLAREERMRAGRDTANEWRRDRNYAELPDLRAGAFADHLRPMVILALNTGIRRGEMFGLQWADVDLANAVLAVVAKSAKSGRTRILPLNAQALETLRAWQDQTGADGYVFKSATGGRFDNIQSSWEKVCREAGITNLRWHDLRHSFASRLVQRGVDLFRVQTLMGHASSKMTERYSHLQPHHLRAAVDVLGAPPGDVVAFRKDEAAG